MTPAECAAELARRPGILPSTTAAALTENAPLAQHALPGPQPVQVLEMNATGRDFTVGDIHGMYEPLDALLAHVEFNPAEDRLLPIGDLIDRGPQSARAQELLDADWCHPVRGNHDQLLIDAAYSDDPRAMSLWGINGGRWHRDEAQLHSMAAAMAATPLAIELTTETGTVGLVHAELPADRDWPEFTTAVNTGNRVDLLAALWNVTIGQLACGLPPDEPALKLRQDDVQGIDRLVHGHFRVPIGPKHWGNRWLIDTGAEVAALGYSRLTMLQLHPGPWQAWSTPTLFTDTGPEATKLPGWVDADS